MKFDCVQELYVGTLEFIRIIHVCVCANVSEKSFLI